MKYSKASQKQLETLTGQMMKQLGNTSTETQTEKLREVIRYHDWRYYVLSDPKITDFDYDALFKWLKQTEENNPKWVTPDSPTQRVAQALTDDHPAVEHLVPMLSLDNSYNLEDLQDFAKRMSKLVQGEVLEFAIEPKFDGGSISLIYENDQLVRAATRGNGIKGEEITNNARAMKSIPLSAKFSDYGIAKAEIRGEVVIEASNFEAINKIRMKENEALEAEGKKPQELFKNSRNTASGTLRVKDPQEVVKRRLEAFVYHISYAIDEKENDVLGNSIKTHHDAVELLSSLGFKTPDQGRTVSKTVKEVHEFVNRWGRKT